MLNLEKAAEVILLQAQKRPGFAELGEAEKRAAMAADLQRVIQTLTHKWKGCISLIEELGEHPDVRAASVPPLPADYRLEKLEGPKADEGKLLTETAQAMARAVLEAAIARRLNSQ